MMANPAYSFENNYRTDFYDFLDKRLNQMEEDNELESLNDITKMIFNNRADIMGHLALSFIEKKFGHLINQEYCPCPHCNKLIKAMPRKARREIETMVGPTILERPYFYCKPCKYGFFPLDEALGLSARKKQHDIQETEAFLAAETPYETACETFERCTGLDMSNHHMHEVVREIGQKIDILDVCPSKEEIYQQINILGEDKFRRPILMLAIDGAHAPTRPEPSPRKGKRGDGEWKEVKGFRFYLINGARIIHLISWHQIQEHQELAADLSRLKDAGLIPEDRVRLCVIGDGAPWIWNRINELFPNAKMVLDYYHCSEYVHDLAKTQYGKNSQEAREWAESILTRLFCNEIEEIFFEMKKLKHS